MTVLQPANIAITQLVGVNNYDNQKLYTHSIYNITKEIKEDVIIFNTFSRAIVLLDKKEYKKYLELDIDVLSDNQLIYLGFIVEKNLNEHKLANQTLSLIRNITLDESEPYYIIYTTTDCNARCYYCFEDCKQKLYMSKSTAADVAEYIAKQNKRVRIKWFGGEPLCNSAAIDVICKKLKENNVSFESIMISNGYLFNNELAIKAKNEWKLESVQITLDGTEEIYNKTKAYIYKTQESAFVRVINNIKTLLSNDIKVSVRLNLSENNLEDIFLLANQLYTTFSNSGIYVYPALLYPEKEIMLDVSKRESRHFLTEKMWELEDYFLENDMLWFSSPTSKIKTKYCIADMRNSFTILPDGKIGKCDYHADNATIGDIYLGFEGKPTYWSEYSKPIELCKSCPVFPQCLKLKDCPSIGAYVCDKYVQNTEIRHIKFSLITAYNSYKNNLGRDNQIQGDC